MSVRKVIVQDRQTVFDIAIQEYGSAEGCFLLMADNPDKVTHLTMDLVPGTKLKIISPPVNKPVASFMRTNGIQPVSISTAPPSLLQSRHLRGDFGLILRADGGSSLRGPNN
jgi:hypothetical protein